ncbi:phosphotransferase [Pseudoalteromonas sp. MMG006]|uniref:phosphotransferase n=1 Tax=Pseudoalteromonas sp. MMG006 TaxID=2822683 RepID=UPI001B36B584|nr:phosphotransferase [Pseudoalteromonas sp. MMG006]MBQ4800232.1 phosphotransferase [Pseudoalteromonas sp. MMG006]
MIEHTKLVKVCSAFIEPLSIVSTEQLLNGFSNDNFLIRTQQSAYLLKCYKTQWPTIGLQAQQALSKQFICPKPIWTDKKNNYAAFNYIEGDIAQNNTQQNLISKLAKVHAYPVKTPAMNIAQELLYYQQSDIYKHHQLQIEQALKSIAHMPYSEGFCHNDLVKDNIIVNASGMYLIDFEYAQTNDVYFDLAALAVSFNLNAQSREALLNSYKACLEKKDGFYFSTKKLDYYILLFLVLCIGWYEQRDINTKSAGLRAQLIKLLERLRCH